MLQDRAAPAIAAADKPYARIAVLRPHDGDTVDFEAGYIRHLAWHQQAKDTWVWYGWNITFGERQRWFVYASFGHSADSLDSPVAPADDERDNVLNVVPHAEFVGNALYEYLPRLSRGTGVPQPTARAELTTVDVRTGAEKDFEDGVAAVRLHRLDGVADLGEALRELVVGEPREVDVVAQPVAGEFHRGADSSVTACG